MTTYWAGIGSRATPSDILSLMVEIAKKLCQKGYILRSGGAIGADQAFENGCAHIDNNKIETFYWKNATPEAIEIASDLHPNWRACSDMARKLHGRNAMILLGQNLDTPVKFVICWTKNGGPEGGTGMGIRIAQKYDIPVYNLFFDKTRETIKKQLGIV